MARRAAALGEYNRKRDFSRTSEPKGEVAKGDGRRFVVQKHDATRLHYDFRFEVDGVLKSWAVTRGPSLNPDDKRLAVRTEDHPLSYGGFEGVIPKGEYGGGTVMLWDEGEWAPVEGKSARDIEKGHLHFTLRGERMRGEWLLIRLRPRPGEKRENWLLRKIDDPEAGGSDDLVTRALTSIKTGRTMAEIAAGAPAISLKGKTGKSFDAAMAEARAAEPRARKAPGRTWANTLPGFRSPQLATLVDSVPTGNGWFHEIKYDGYRCLAAIAGGKVRIFTRSGLDWTERFGAVVEALAAFDLPPVLIDGEIVALDGTGNPDFSTLQRVLNGEAGELAFFAFDLLTQEGGDMTHLPNIERKERLAALIGGGGETVRVADHVVGAGEALFAAMCGAGQEGIISKRADAPYRGDRSHHWLKVKCTRREEFVVVGWTPSGSAARSIRNLLLAQHREGDLAYAGKVGTGFGAADEDMLLPRLKRLERKTAPVEVAAKDRRGVTWMTPKLVAEVAYAEFTGDGVLRHARFLGLREDKAPDDIHREEAEPMVEQATPAQVAISNRDRLVFPEAKITKGELADYYEKVGAIMLPWVANRPLSLVRCPQGRARKCFFQKHDSGSFGEQVHHVPVREKDGGIEDYLYVDSVAGLIACVQMGSIEFHGWGSRVEDIEKPDRMIFDLDPDTAVDFDAVKAAARHLRHMLEDIGLVSFAMLSGGKGVHVVVPLTPEAEWPAVKDFAKRFSTAIAQTEPDRFIATMSKAKRAGRIFIDWLRNQRGSTAILPYAVRAREGAPVAVPVTWDELDDFDRAGAFTVKDADLLLERASSRALRGWGQASQVLPDL